MLKIQRASAGSGKTYALARNFILNIIAFRNEAGEWKLRNSRQIDDALRHILAITFTNKATNEMKERIVKNLSILSRASNFETIKEEEIKNFPYLKDFMEILNEPVGKIGETAHLALMSILNNYSNFKISTIDSFFQEILRVFSYEANINDSYKLEIDSNYISDLALDSALQSLDVQPEKMGIAGAWLKIIMKEEARKSKEWNPFQKKNSARSVFSKIRRALIQLESEEFKKIKEDIERYHEENQGSKALLDFYKDFRYRAEEEREKLLRKIQNRSKKIEDIMVRDGLGSEQLSVTFINQLNKISGLKIRDKLDITFSSFRKERSVYKKKYRTEGNEIDCLAMEMYDLVEEWQTPTAKSYYKYWKIYGNLIPYLGLILETRSFISGILEDENIIRISDTGYILKKIIGDSDAPFIYERLGNRIDNYLIDEFQDTSRLQWEIIKPLLTEGVAKDKDSLIIGDPKQSIYRFRNANHTLITETVPETFRYNHIPAGFSKEENTNWRSLRNIVKFNNFLFKNLASLLSHLSKEKGAGDNDFEKIYSNVVQNPHKKGEKGYVEINFLESSANTPYTDDPEEPHKDLYERAVLEKTGDLISSLIERGYRQKDIGILVNTNEKGKHIIEFLIGYNETRKEDERINFVSEESLLVSSSPAVEIILEFLRKLVRRNFKKGHTNENDTAKVKYTNWNQIKSDFIFYSRQHSEWSAPEALLKFLEKEEESFDASSLMQQIPVTSLSAITEIVVKTFISEELKKSDALYIASFQDLVSEYSASYNDDPSSFLEWWNARGKNVSVSSPEGIDAVQVMTIHKSKGLEFQCVIIPFATDSFLPSPLKSEWRWVRPVITGLDNIPPVLPIQTDKELEGSAHENIYFEYFNQVVTDKLNMYYVAFTRAIDELYVFAKTGEKKGYSIGDYLKEILKSDNPYDKFSDEEKDDVITKQHLEISEDGGILTLGHKLTKEEILEEKKKEESVDEKIKIHTLKGYFVNNTRPRLKSKASKILPSGEL